MKRSICRAIAAALVIVFVFAALGNASTTARAATENGLLKVTGVSWYAPNSTELAVPGTNYVPLLVSFIVLANSSSGTVLNASVNLTSQFAYSGVSGGSAKTVISVSPVTQGGTYTLLQMVNISASAQDGLYTENLSYTITGGAVSPITGSSQFTLPLLGSVNLVSAGSEFGTPSAPILGTPGMKFVPLSVSIENTGNSPVTNVSATYTPAGYLYGSAQTTYISAMSPFGFEMLTFLVSISANATQGFVQQSIVMNYNGANHTLAFSVPVTGYSNISVVNYFTNPPAIYQNEKYITLTIYTANSGNSFSGPIAVSASSSSFEILTAPYLLPAYPEGAELNFTFLLDAMNHSGPAPVTVTIGSAAYVIPLYLKSEGEMVVASKIPVFNPGNSKQIELFTLTNAGNSTMYDISIHLLSPSIVSIHIPSSNPFAALTANNITFAELLPHQTIDVTFSVDTASNAPTGEYPAQLLVTWMYNDSSTVFHKTYAFSEVVSRSSIQQFTDTFTLNPLNGAILGVMIAVVAILAGLAVRGARRRRKERGAGGQHVHNEGEEGGGSGKR